MGNTSSQTPKRVYGWKKDTPDPDDIYRLFELRRRMATITHVDLRPKMPPVYDQGNLGSCTANAIAGAYQYDQIIQNEPTNFTPSRLFIYYNERKIEGTIDEDSGATIRDGMKTIHTEGVCPECDWEYDITKFAVCPPELCYQEAQKHKSLLYHRVSQDLNQLRSALIEGYPVVFGFLVYSSFESDTVMKTGVVPMPDTSKEKLLGGHAVVLVGFDDNSQRFIVRNSWGPDWGDHGYFTMPYAYVLDPNLASDFWILQRVEDTE